MVEMQRKAVVSVAIYTPMCNVQEHRNGQNVDDNVPGRPKGPRPSTSFQSDPTLSSGTACVFSSVLGESHTRSSGFKELNRRLDQLFPDRRKIEAKLREGTAGFASLSKALGSDSGMAVLVSGNPSRSLSTSEQQKLVDFIVDGGHLVVAASAGGCAGTNFNDMLSLFGITVNQDAVIRSAFHKYFHPKEVFITDGIVSRNTVDSIERTAESSTGMFSCASSDSRAHLQNHSAK
jgi:hypothetical protein